jgi:hypothetical protein
MTTEPSFRFTPNVVVGLGVMVLGIVLMLDNLGALEARALLPYWPVFLIVFGASVVVQAVQGRAEGDAAAERPVVTPSTVVFVVLAFLFVSYVQERRERVGGHLNLFAVMSADEVTRPEQPFRGGEVTTIMGRTRLDLRTAELAPGETAVVDVFNLMSRTEIRVPPGWEIDVRAVRAMAGVRDTRPREARPPVSERADPDVVERTEPSQATAPPRLVVRGFIMMGGLTVGS